MSEEIKFHVIPNDINLDKITPEMESIYEIGWPRKWITKEEAKEIFPDKKDE